MFRSLARRVGAANVRNIRCLSGLCAPIRPVTASVVCSIPSFSHPHQFNTATFTMSSEHVVLRVNDLSPADLKNKTVFVRVDYNITLELVDGKYQVKKSSYKRIIESLPTLKYLLDSGAKVVLASHLGDPKDDPAPFCLAPAADVVREQLNVPVSFVNNCIGDSVKEAVAALQPGSVLLLDNLRYHKGEKKNDPAFVNALIDAVDMDVYVNDAFGTAHRAHASVVGVPNALRARAAEGKKKVPCVSGFLMGKEVKYLSEAIPVARTPGNVFAAVLGGAKVTSKLPVFAHLLPRADKVLVGGAMALPFLKAQGFNISNVDDEAVKAAQSVLDQANATGAELVLPVDFLTAKQFEDPAITGETPVNYPVAALPDGVYCLDIGEKSMETFKNALSTVNTVVWNGPMGKFEWPAYIKGSLAIVEALSAPGERVSIVGGGETGQVVGLAKSYGVEPHVTHVSTGGGASLEMLQGDVLPAIAALDTK